MANPGDFDFYCQVALKPDSIIKKVFESEKVLAFYHTKPSFDRHIMVIPKQHYHDLRYINDSDLVLELMQTAQNILKSWDDDYIANHGARIVTNLGAFQDTPHLHIHVIGGEKLVK